MGLNWGMINHTRLSKTQLKVLELISAGLSTIEIADRLGSKPKTIENHRSNIARKLGITGNNCVLRYAFTHKNELNPSHSKSMMP